MLPPTTTAAAMYVTEKFPNDQGLYWYPTELRLGPGLVA